MENENKSGQNQQTEVKRPSSFRRILALILIVIGLGLVFWYLNSGPQGKEVEIGFLRTELMAERVEKIERSNSRIEFQTKDGKWYWFYNRSDSAQIFNDLLAEHYQIIDEYNLAHQDEPNFVPKAYVTVVLGTPSTFSILNIIFPLLMAVTLIVIVVMVMRQIRSVNSRSMEFTKNRARVAESKVKFDKVAGADEEKEELEEIIQFLKDPDRFTKIGARIPKGVLLVGPPGTGKTLLAKAVAGEANVPFFTISGSDFMELYVGVGASRVRDLFENAKMAKPCIVFIDEIDAVGRQRGTGLGGGNDEREQTLNQLLVQMDGFETNEGIIVMAATNRADILDPALTRPGRFDRQIYINPPDVKGREEILRVHAKNKPLASDVKLKEIARVTSGFTGADLENLLNEAAILAARRKRVTISQDDINSAITKVTMGPQKRSRVVSEKDKHATAIHESGHAIVEKCVKNSNPVHEVSIIQRGGAAGYTISRPDNDDNSYTKNKLLDTISVLLAGRGAEELFLDDVSAGASNDLSRATEIARRMVTEFGMSDGLGLVHYGESSQPFIGRDYQTRAVYSETEASKIDAEIKKIIDKCYEQTRAILSSHKKEVETMVAVLMEKETIFSDEVDMILKGSTKEEVVEFIDSRLKSKKEEDEKKKAEIEKAKVEKIALQKQQTSSSAGDYVDNLLKEADKRAKERETSAQKSSPAQVTHETTAPKTQPAAEKKPESEVKPKENKVEPKAEQKAEKPKTEKAEPKAEVGDKPKAESKKPQNKNTTDEGDK